MPVPLDAAAPPSTTQPRPRVLVIGAGMAGLTAAHDLRNHGCQVVVLEATSRPGGRIRTLRQPFADGLYADAGAMVFTDANTHVKSCIASLNLPIRPVPPSSKLYHLHGGQFTTGLGHGADWPAGLDLTPAERQLDANALLTRYFVTGVLDPVMSPLDPQWPPDTLKAYDQMTATEFLAQRGASAGAIEIFSAGMLSLVGEGLASISALSVLAVVAMSVPARMVFWIPGGSDLLARAMATELTGHIHYGCPVQRIEASDAGVSVTVSGAGTGRTYSGDYVVVAVPFAALRSVKVAPLSPEKQRIIAELGSTSVTRTFLQFRDRFWEPTDSSGAAVTDLPIGVIYSAYPLAGRRGVLETYTVGAEARRMAALSEDERLREALQQIALLFPGAHVQCESGVSTCWDHDPWAQGAYAWYKPGQLMDFLPHLSQPEGRLFFAGDGTTPLPGWTEAALFSGRRAAQQVLGAAGVS